MARTDGTLTIIVAFLQQLRDTRGNMYVPIYQLNMSKCPRQQMDNESDICISRYKFVTFPPTPSPTIGNLYRFPVSCGLKKCLPSREGRAPLRGVAPGGFAESASIGSAG